MLLSPFKENTQSAANKKNKDFLYFHLSTEPNENVRGLVQV